MLFSEPKIPQYDHALRPSCSRAVFQCSSASRKFLNAQGWPCRGNRRAFQCSSASRKFLNCHGSATMARRGYVSVLFSEPKIPQSSLRHAITNPPTAVSVLFSEPKIPQSGASEHLGKVTDSFSALQRAENSSIFSSRMPRFGRGWSFSALQRAENSSILRCSTRPTRARRFQCSSASRKFLNRAAGQRAAYSGRVSVLFSEPKIPQLHRLPHSTRVQFAFQCSSASRKFLNAIEALTAAAQWICFSALQRAENSSIIAEAGASGYNEIVSVLFSEPKIPQSTGSTSQRSFLRGFSALQRAENSSIHVDVESCTR